MMIEAASLESYVDPQYVLLTKDYAAAAKEILLRNFLDFPEALTAKLIDPVFEEGSNRQLFGALTAENRLIGVCYTQRTLFVRTNHFGIAGLCVEKEYRNRGIGTRLLTFAVENLALTKTAADGTVELVQGGDSSEAFYRRSGFKTVQLDVLGRPVMVRRVSGNPLHS